MPRNIAAPIIVIARLSLLRIRTRATCASVQTPDKAWVVRPWTKSKALAVIDKDMRGSSGNGVSARGRNGLR